MRDFASDKLPENDTEAVYVRGFGVLLSSQYLRRHPVRRTDLSTVIFDKFVLISGQSKVAYFDRPIVVQQNILAFQIAVEYIF